MHLRRSGYDFTRLEPKQIGTTLRDSTKHKAAKWMHNRVNYWRGMGLVIPVYETKNYVEYVTKIRLTGEGKEELGRGSGNPLSTAETYPVSETQSGGNVDNALYDVLKLVSDWSGVHPEYEVTFEVKHKGVAVAIHTPGKQSDGNEL